MSREGCAHVHTREQIKDPMDQSFTDGESRGCKQGEETKIIGPFVKTGKSIDGQIVKKPWVTDNPNGGVETWRKGKCCWGERRKPKSRPEGQGERGKEEKKKTPNGESLQIEN